MSELFLKIFNISISASWLVLAVLFLRLVLKKAPKWVNVLLWGLVAIRLVCPFTIESMLSLIPSAETIRPDIMLDPTPEIHTGISAVNSVINPIVLESFVPDPGTSMNSLQFWIPLVALVWVAGIAAMLIYTTVSYILLRRKISTAVLLRSNIYQSENVESPFVIGIIKPKIYLPFQMDSQSIEYVVAHEESHIRRKDHWWKPFGFVLLALHWFNPLMWLGYILLCKDIELACDERVIKKMDNENRADYTQALVACSVSRRSIAACPIAFGEVSVKERVKSVMNYKKPAFWIICVAVVACVVVAVCFLTNPAETKDPYIVNVIKTDLNTYYELSDGTWRANGRVYQHRFVISGRMHNAAEDTTFVYLSNLENITFDQAWKAVGFGNNTTDYIPAEDAILVDWHGGKSSVPPVGGVDVPESSAYEQYIDSVSYDIDGDGKLEICTLSYGPTYGLFSFTFNASPMESTACDPKYSETFVLRGFNYKIDISFEITDGVLQLRVDLDDKDSVFFDFAVQDGTVFLLDTAVQGGNILLRPEELK